MDGSQEWPAGPPAADPERVGPFVVEARLGEGGMGAVYLGRAADGTQVAVKVVRPDLAGHPAFRARFHEEARNALRVASFCTARVLDHGEDGGRAYLATEFIEGPSLQQQLDASGPLTGGTLHGVAVGVATALVAIHSVGLVHRDLKPGNVLLSRSGPRVIDFGIARALDEAAALTRTGQLIGTPGFLAPEQVSGGDITPATDVFAWGCLVASAANGRNPFGTGPVHVMAARALHAEPDLGALTEPLAALVRAALDKDPARRPSARDLLLSLVGADAGPPTSPAATVVATDPGHPAAQRTRLADSPGTPPHPLTEPPRPAGNPAPGEPAYGTPQPHREAARPQDDRARAPGESTRPYGDPARSGGGIPQPWTEPATEPAQQNVPPGGPAPGRRRRSRALLAAGAAVTAAAVTAGVLYLVWPDPGRKGSGGAADGFPRDAMLVRIDTERGWPTACFGDIGRYTPGAAAPVPLVTGPSCDILPQWSPDRRRFAFTRSTDTGAGVYVGNADGTGVRWLASDLSGRSRVAWSPDGTRLAYPVIVDRVRQFTVRPVDGGGAATTITTDPADKDDPMWSRAGLVFWSKRDGTAQIYTLDPDRPAQQWKRLTSGDVPAGDPAWSPDGRRIAYTRGKNPGEIWVMNADGTGGHRVTTGTENESDPSWSPDGRWLAYVRGPFTDPVVRAIRADGTGDRVLTPTGALIAHPNW
ncbi:Serine/threonine-protein kinase AfsK [Actinomadura rubteroloni]|uniref:Serine/threonine-protein kinase AfsK n=1 Tax=Actinomadura rubteroloni TaxID=1926885 RepID=A0A2P4UEJ5_9ACTN|nr:protein kinase [Actinomadura rubteroloni]POM23451.1 Serine/threonine-protein kinase AfsK [Actinomadura rubteroloni]